MDNNLHVGHSGLSNNIYCGKILKKGMWAAKKDDVTNEAIFAVAQHVVQAESAVIISDSSYDYIITVEKKSKD